MTIDHANRFLCFPLNYPAYCVGRLAMPLFSFVFAYNLARTTFRFPRHYYQSFRRLIFFGLLATPAYDYMLQLGNYLPLNILFTFFMSAAILFFIQKRGLYLLAAVIVFIFGGVLVEYAWGGILLSIGFWSFYKGKNILAIVLVAISFYILHLINGNNWALLSLVVLFLVRYVPLKVPRLRYFFWIYYPLHLTILWAISYRFVPGLVVGILSNMA